MKVYVQVNEVGYIHNWSKKALAGYQEIECEETLASKMLLDCVRVINGVAQLDETKQAELIQAFNQPTDSDLMKQQNAALMMQLAEQNQIIEQLQQMNAQSAVSQAELDERLKNLEGVEA